MSGYLWFWIWYGWISSAVAAGIVGHGRKAALPGAVLGIFFGPVGLLAAFALDGRSSCPHCAGKLDGRGQICQHCNRPIRWHESPSESSILPLGWLFGGQGSLECPYLRCAAARRSFPLPAMLRQHHLGKGSPIAGLAARQAGTARAQPSDRPWSQHRKVR